MDRDYAIGLVKRRFGLSDEEAERKLDSLIHIYAPELDALTLEIDTSLTFAEEEYFLRILNNE